MSAIGALFNRHGLISPESYLSDLIDLADQMNPDADPSARNVYEDAIAEMTQPGNGAFDANATTQAELLARNNQSTRASVMSAATIQGQHAEEKKKADDHAAQHYAAEIARRAYESALDRTDKALDNLGSALDQAQRDLDDFNRELDEITIKLSDGTKVYYNPETKAFEKQDENRNWHELSEEEQAEAQSKFEAAGMAAVKPDKEYADQRAEEIKEGRVFHWQTTQDKEEIKQKVTAGEISHGEAQGALEGMEKSAGERLRNLNAEHRKSPRKEVKIELSSIDDFLEDEQEPSQNKPGPKLESISGSFKNVSLGETRTENLPATSIEIEKNNTTPNSLDSLLENSF